MQLEKRNSKVHIMMQFTEQKKECNLKYYVKKFCINKIFRTVTKCN
jgi:hypothetical protein